MTIEGFTLHCLPSIKLFEVWTRLEYEDPPNDEDLFIGRYITLEQAEDKVRWTIDRYAGRVISVWITEHSTRVTSYRKED